MNKIVLWSIVGIAGIIVIFLVVTGLLNSSLEMNALSVTDKVADEEYYYSSYDTVPNTFVEKSKSEEYLEPPTIEGSDSPMMDSKVLSSGDTGEKNPQTNKIERKIVYTADYIIHVKDVALGISVVKSRLNDFHGYVSLQTNSRLVMRIPAEYFYDFIGEFSKIGKIIDEQVKAEEVTDQFYMLQRRIEIKESLIKKWEQMRDATKDEKTILEYQKLIDKAIEELEVLKGKMRLLADKISMSTITIDFTTDPSPLPQAPKHRMNVPYRWMRDLRVENLLGDHTYVETDED